MTKRILSLLLAVIMLLSMFTGCGAQEESTDAPATDAANTAGTEDGVNLVYGIMGTWNSLQPFNGPSTYSCMLQDVLYEPLAISTGAELVYRAAESIEVSEDGLSWIVKLNPNCTWSDGTPTTAHDWVWTYEVETDPSFGVYASSYIPCVLAGTDASGIRVEGEELGIKALDDYTLQLTFKTPTAIDPFFGWYGVYFRALPKHLLEDVAPSELASCDYWNNPIGNGPLTFVSEPVLGQEITFAARDDYYLGEMQFDTLTYLVVSSDNAANALMNGDIDTFFNISDFETMENILAENENLHMVQGEGKMDIFSLSVNNVRFNANVRKALSMLIDREIICEALTYGYGVPKSDPVLSSGEAPARDVEGAKAILEAEGFDFENTVITIACGAVRQNLATIIQQNWLEAGVKSEIQTGETATIFAQAISGEVDCCIMGNGLSYNPTGEESILDPASTTYAQIQDTKYVDLCLAIDFETDEAKKAELVDEFVQAIRNEAPYVYLYAVPCCMVMSDRVDGILGGYGDLPWTWTVNE